MDPAMKRNELEPLEKMRLGINYSFPIVLRGLTIKARPLSIIEQHQVLADSKRDIEAVDSKFRTPFDEAAILAQHYIITASDNDPNVSAYILNRASPEELSFLYKEYCAVVDKCNPMFEQMTAQDIGDLVEKIKKNKNPVLALTDLSFHQLASICRRLLEI